MWAAMDAERVRVAMDAERVREPMRASGVRGPQAAREVPRAPEDSAAREPGGRPTCGTCRGGRAPSRTHPPVPNRGSGRSQQKQAQDRNRNRLSFSWLAPQSHRKGHFFRNRERRAGVPDSVPTPAEVGQIRLRLTRLKDILSIVPPRLRYPIRQTPEPQRRDADASMILCCSGGGAPLDGA